MYRYLLLMVVFVLGCSRGGSNVNDTSSTQDTPGGVITFTSNRDGDFEIYTVDLGTKESSRLTHHPETDYYSSWSPTGKQIVFIRHVMVMPISM